MQSEKVTQFYTGHTNNLKEQLKVHNERKLTSTKYRIPLKLIYFEGCINQQDAPIEKNIKKRVGVKDI